MDVGIVVCDECGKNHVAEFSHMSRWDDTKKVYAVICTDDDKWLTDYYLIERVSFTEAS